MPQPTDNQLAAAAQKARADHETAREIAARLLAPPDPVDILAGVIADRGDVADERDELRAKCDALTAERDDLRASLSEVASCFTSASTAHVLSSQTIVLAIGDLRTAADAAADLRAALDRVATAAGVDTDSTGAIVADRVIAVLRAMQARPAALPADLRTYLETRRDRLQGGHGLGLAAEIAALNRWLALPTAEMTP